MEGEPPVVVSPDPVEAGSVDGLIERLRDVDALSSLLLERGAILFRGFGVTTPAHFRRAVESMDRPRAYVDGNAPRRRLAPGIYTSTEYPPEYFISLHNELSYSSSPPRTLFFGCIVAPSRGGATCIADGRKVLRSLDPSVARLFRERKIMYVRNLHSGRGYGLPWYNVFETNERAVVEQFCRESMTDWLWREDGSLRLEAVRPAVARHPITGDEVWFSQADQFHPTTHPEEIRRAIEESGLQQDEFPQNALFGDGSPMDTSMLDHIRTTCLAQSVRVQWQRGDFLVLDNYLMSHGRMPYQGARRILVAMS